MSATNPSRFEDLVSRHLDEELPPSDASELVALLAEPELAARFLEMTRLNSEIGGLLAAPVPDAAMVELVRADIEKSLAGGEQSGDVRLRIVERLQPGAATARHIPMAQPLPRRPTRTRWRLAWAAVLFVFAGMAAVLVFNRTTTDVPVVASVQGEVRLEGKSGEHLLTSGESWQGDERLITVGPKSTATVRFRDGSQLDFSANVVAFNEAGKNARRVRLEHGSVQAMLMKQPAQRPFVLDTPEAEAIVVGTTLRLIVIAHSTRLEVTEGTVRFRRRHDGAEIAVSAGHYAVAAPNVLLVPTAFHPDPHHP